MNKILISVPCRDMISVGFVEDLFRLIKPCQCDIRFGISGLVFDARDEAAQIAVTEGYSHVLFIDSDMTFEPLALVKALSREDDILTGLYFKRKDQHGPVAYKHIQMRLKEDACAEPIDTIEDYFEVEGCGFGFCLVKTSVLLEVFKGSVSCFEPLPGMGEDLSFCLRAINKGFKIMCDSTIEIGHIGSYVYSRKDWINDRP